MPALAPPAASMLFLASAALLLASCWRDIATRTLPDSLTLLLAAVGVTWQVLAGDPVWSLAAAALVFLAAALLWNFGAMGGGDVKLLGACSLLVPPLAVPGMLLATAVAGGALAAIYLLGRRFPPAIPASAPGLPARVWRAELRRIGRGGPLPYALAIAAGTLFTLMDRV